ncbi:MAG: DNA mismatch repair protein MutS, partial [Candidatus Azotimanducaceae bacterium]
DIVFVRQVVKGARLAGLPTTVIDRAKTILERLEADDSSHNLLSKRMKKEKSGSDTSEEDDQLALF